jgi:hypothetical protein
MAKEKKEQQESDIPSEVKEKVNYPESQEYLGPVDDVSAPNEKESGNFPEPQNPPMGTYPIKEVLETAKASDRFSFLQKEKMQARRNFTEVELIELGASVANDHARVEELKDEAKSAAAEYKTQIANLVNMIKNNSRKIIEGFEMEPITVHVYLDYETKKRIYINPVNGIVMKETDFKMEDFQRKIEVPELGDSISKNPHGTYKSDLGLKLAGIFDAPEQEKKFEMKDDTDFDNGTDEPAE